MDQMNTVLILLTIAAGVALLASLGKVKFSVKFAGSKIRTTAVKINETWGTMDYNVYAMKPYEYAMTLILAAAILFVIGMIFYRNMLLSLLLALMSFLYPKVRIRQIIIRRKEELKQQFKDALHSLSSSLQAGKSFETAMRCALVDLLIQYEPDSYIVQEFEIIVRKLESNETIEKAFDAFADRSGIEEIQSFAEILEVCKRTGGNLIAAIKSSTEVISDKIEVIQEINSILAQKKLEQNILTAMPILMVLMLSVSAKEFIQPVFTEIIGRIVMTASIALFSLAYFIAGKITNIEV